MSGTGGKNNSRVPRTRLARDTGVQRPPALPPRRVFLDASVTHIASEGRPGPSAARLAEAHVTPLTAVGPPPRVERVHLAHGCNLGAGELCSPLEGRVGDSGAGGDSEGESTDGGEETHGGWAMGDGEEMDGGMDEGLLVSPRRGSEVTG